MKSIARTYASKRECSVQEAVLPCYARNFGLGKTFPGVIFANSNIPETPL